ncbi:Uncharacterised protein [Mycobacteroides abscessus subsp. abscessus]|nr:Uncharacterised protein [Mycobacteroides abscessus subsp. abscessus]
MGEVTTRDLLDACADIVDGTKCAPHENVSEEGHSDNDEWKDDGAQYPERDNGGIDGRLFRADLDGEDAFRRLDPVGARLEFLLGVGGVRAVNRQPLPGGQRRRHRSRVDGFVDQPQSTRLVGDLYDRNVLTAREQRLVDTPDTFSRQRARYLLCARECGGISTPQQHVM